MSNVKKNLAVLIIWMLLSLILASIGTLMVFWKVFNQTDALIFVSCVLSFLVLGLLEGNIRQKKGLLNGLLIGLVLLIIFMLINFLGFESGFSLKLAVKYLVMLLSSGIGGAFGVNFRPFIK